VLIIQWLARDLVVKKFEVLLGAPELCVASG
jgi:hypothetical protein